MTQLYQVPQVNQIYQVILVTQLYRVTKVTQQLCQVTCDLPLSNDEVIYLYQVTQVPQMYQVILVREVNQWKVVNKVYQLIQAI